jgi:hypothetical protein
MPETVTVAGKKLPKNVVYLGAAGAAGFVAYAWWSKGTRDEAPAPDLPSPVAPPMDDTEFNVIGGGGRPKTNGEWFTYARDQLIAVGMDGAAVGTALGRFLDRKPLTTTEANIVRQAIGMAGYPPEGGSYTIIEVTPGGTQPPPTEPPPTEPPPVQPPAVQPAVPSAPPTPGRFKAVGAKDTVWLAWDPSPGASWYEWTRFAAGQQDAPWINVGGQTAIAWPQEVGEDTHYAYGVRAGGVGGYSSIAYDDTWILA